MPRGGLTWGSQSKFRLKSSTMKLYPNAHIYTEVEIPMSDRLWKHLEPCMTSALVDFCDVYFWRDQEGVWKSGHCGAGESESHLTSLLVQILLQTVTPAFVATAMSGIKRTSFFVPSAVAYARAAVATIGILNNTFGCFAHTIQVSFLFWITFKDNPFREAFWHSWSHSSS